MEAHFIFRVLGRRKLDVDPMIMRIGKWAGGYRILPQSQSYAAPQMLVEIGGVSDTQSNNCEDSYHCHTD